MKGLDMLTIEGQRIRCCDGIPRRSFVKIGTLGLGGLTLADMLRLDANAEQEREGRPQTSVIFLELAGGPTQFETYDPKPDAPAEYRGALQAIETQLPGVYFSELMVEQARIADKLAIIRSIHHNSSSHDPSSHLTQTGYYKKGPKGGPNQFPCIGSVIGKLRGSNSRGIPAYVAVPSIMRNGAAAYAGKSYNPFETGGDPNKDNFTVKNLSLGQGLSLARLDDRKSLLKSLDETRQLLDNEGVVDSIDGFNRQAFDLLTGSAARRAFDVHDEADSVRDLYGRNTVGQSMLLARRLVEAGVTFVTVRVTGWDDHNKLVPSMKKKGPNYDRGAAALISDLCQRGLDRSVLVVAMGEFGRTPRVNSKAGRDHWGAVMSVMLAGGGMRMGQIIGASNPKGEVPAAAPYRPESVLATVYRHLNIDPATTLPDYSGRPRHLLERRELIQELI